MGEGEKMRARVIFAAAVLVAFGSSHATEVYRWVDKDGKVVYSDLPPPASAKNPELRKLGTNAVDVDKVPFATRDAAKKSPVTLYANNCGEPCDNARQFLAKRGVPFATKNPEASQADADALKKLIGALEVPVLVLGKNPIKGYDAASWEAALDAAGYPRTAAVTSQTAVKPGAAPTTKSESTPTAKAETGSPTSAQ
jgi:glutaredoxin